MKNNKKPNYNMWQNTWFMLKNAWSTEKTVPVFCILLAVLTTASSTAELLAAPLILNRVESGVSVRELIITVSTVSVVLLLFSGLAAYVDTNTLFGRIHVRLKLDRDIVEKLAGTSYCNLLDTTFFEMHAKACDCIHNSNSSAEHIWTVWCDILIGLMSFAIYLTLMSDLNGFLILLVITTTIVSHYSGKRIEAWGYRNREEKQKLRNQTRHLYQWGLNRNYAKDIRIFGLKDWLLDVYSSTLRIYQSMIAKEERTHLWADFIDLLLALLRNGLAYGYILFLTWNEGLSASEFLLYTSAVTGFTAQIRGILNGFTTLRRESVELSYLREFLEWPEPFLLADGNPLDVNHETQYVLELKDVTYQYPGAEKPTISHMNLTLRPDEKTAIVGLNGAGKSTLVKLLCGFLDPTDGQVLLNGHDIRDFNRNDYYKLFSAVFQDFSVLDCSVTQNVAQTVGEIDEDRVLECLEKAGLTEKIMSLPGGLSAHIGRNIYEDGFELSGGQIQRLMLARALYKNAPIMILDEPTAALDPIAEHDIYMKYNDMTEGRISLFISHRLASTRFCDRILFLEHGMITECGTHEELLAQGSGYAELFRVQSKYYQEDPNGQKGGPEYGEAINLS